MNTILSRARELQTETIGYRRYLHQHAEVGFDLPLTTTFVKDTLRQLGYVPQEICAGGIMTTIGDGNGKTFLLRADMDALPMEEHTDLPFKTVTDAAHTCGHDIHTAMLLSAAKILKEHEAAIHGTIVLMFQPAEESISGAQAMIEAGVLKQPPVDAALAIHVSSLDPAGTIYYKGDEIYASADGFEIHIQGRGGHGAAPQTTIDPINIGCHLHLALQALISRETNPSDMGVLTIGAIHAGSLGNIIPDSLVMRGTIRTYDKSLREQLKKRLIQVSQGIATTFGGSATVDFINGTTSMIADPTLTAEVQQWLESLLPAEQVAEFPAPFTGSEDFALISEVVPATMLILGCAIEGVPFDHHHPSVQFNEEAFSVGVAAYAYCALQWLTNH